MSAATGCTTLVTLARRDGTSGFCMDGQWAHMATGGVSHPERARVRFHAALAIAAVFAAMIAMPSSASERWFTVEVIVFDDLRNDGLEAEQWPADPGEPSLRGTVELTDWPAGESGESAHAFRIVKRSEHTLDAVWNKLRGSAHYRPFLHLGWRLPGLPHGAARPCMSARILAAVAPGPRNLSAADHRWCTARSKCPSRATFRSKSISSTSDPQTSILPRQALHQTAFASWRSAGCDPESCTTWTIPCSGY